MTDIIDQIGSAIEEPAVSDDDAGGERFSWRREAATLAASRRLRRGASYWLTRTAPIEASTKAPAAALAHSPADAMAPRYFLARSGADAAATL